MTYEIFKMTLLNELKGYFPASTSISVNEIPRNNNIMLDGLTILESGFNIAPTIYIQDYYEEFRQGASMDTILKNVLHSYSSYRPTENINTSFYCDLNNVSSRIVYKLVNYKKNKKLLDDIPHIPYLDLAVVFYCLVSTGHLSNATILIHNRHLDFWDIGKEGLLALAKKNTPLLLPPQCEELSQLLAQFFPDEVGAAIKKMDEGTYLPMYVLTNETRMDGAACILYDNLISDLAGRLKSDLYILPSSIHEAIIVPSLPDMSIQYFSNMVKDVNLTQVSDEEILSDHAYYFSRKDNKITNAN